MTAVTADRFGEYFEHLHDHEPYPWQRRLAARAADGDWPGAIDLPTGSGKTACLDVAVFALACQALRPANERTAPRRIFFCVNRRVIVDEAHQRARRIAQRIWSAERSGTGILTDVAAALRASAGTDGRPDLPPLDVLELRGGIYRDNRWARSIAQPTIVCTTLDQLGSRLLFRGYGVSPGAAPIHAALIAYDSLILLDEAHISEPFRQTLDSVARYLDPDRWTERTIGPRPAIVAPMTATPNDEMRRRGVIHLHDDDRAPRYPLLSRLVASKPAELPPPANDLADQAVKTALRMAGGGPAAVGVIVNRVKTARAVYERLLQETSTGRTIPPDTAIELVIGSMRPLDRDRQVERLSSLVGPNRPAASHGASFVVATQCLEVGADYDFDVLITECASLDALRQRFGRLNRAGRDLHAHGVILADRKAIKPDDRLDDEDPIDPIYGNALARTWNWLTQRATEVTTDGKTVKTVDFGIDAFDRLLRDQADAGRPPQALLAPSASANAPLVMPAYLDLWCQTAPRPVPDPDVSLFIHGVQDSEPDVQVCWRADLIEDARMQADEHWCDVVALLPPTSAECMSVPISRMRRWLIGQADDDRTGDLIGEAGPGAEQDDGQEDRRKHISVPKAVLWRGLRRSTLLRSPDDLKPGDTVVLPACVDRPNLLGHLPEWDAGAERKEEASDVARPTVRDHGEASFRRARDRAALRLHPALGDLLGPQLGDLLAAAARCSEQPLRHGDWRALLAATSEALPDSHEWKQILGHLATHGLHVEPYPDERGVVLTSRERLGSTEEWFLPATDDGEDESSLSERKQPVGLADHTRHVVEAVQASTGLLPLSIGTDLFIRTAEMHDLGKADERFQAMLRRSDRTDAWLRAGLAAALWAKSDGVPQTRAQGRDARRRAGLPEAFRHEMLSIQLAEHGASLPADEAGRDLLLHLVAAHHGHARPFAPVTIDEELPRVAVNGIELNHERRAALVPPHRIDSGVAERFWRLTRQYGWWGLAYLEAVLRLADQQASADEEAGRFSGESTRQPREVTT
ncbi:MAG: type I-U CRISPR-associated helicase/endonuclease Cas3 [Acidobacteriota bacterium]|nr:type I-U CRISPR-associated helicase/endonuclease Cas3 [Acidobacteriota bacterium]